MTRSLTRTLSTLALAVLARSAPADLDTEFAGFTWIDERGVSGLMSDYDAPTKSGNYLPAFLQSLGPGRVDYPYIGTEPSGNGAAEQRAMDQGRLGVRVAGGNLSIKIAGGIDPRLGYYGLAWNARYSAGDMFLTVSDANGIAHFALLNAWPSRNLNGHFDDAETFHKTGGAGGSSLVGHLVRLATSADVTPTGGTGSYNSSNAPPGLDLRAYAEGGTDLGDAGLLHTQTTDTGLGGQNQTWYIQTWTLPLSWLSDDDLFSIGLHLSPSCGNDQIGANFRVPAPGAALLGLIGLSTLAATRRRAG